MISQRAFLTITQEQFGKLGETCTDFEDTTWLTYPLNSD
jgi:hypothetical protein